MRCPAATLTRILLALLTMAVISARSETVLAQADPPTLLHGPHPGPVFIQTWSRTYASLATNRGIPQELGLTAEQIQQVKKIADALEERFRAEYFAPSKPVDRNVPRVGTATALDDKMRKLADSNDRECRERLAKVLTPAQSTRLQQIHYQGLGMEALLSRPEVREALQLTPEQTASIQKTADEHQSFVRTLNTPESVFKTAADFEEKLLSQLTETQRGALEALFGEKVDRDKLLYGPAGRPPGTPSPQEILRNQAK